MSKIDVSSVDLRQLLREAYHLSQPQGMGFLHYTPGEEISDEEIDDRINDDGRMYEHTAASVDYLRGRSMKFRVMREETSIPGIFDKSRRYIEDSWHDHSDDALRILLRRVGIEWTPEDRAD